MLCHSQGGACAQRQKASAASPRSPPQLSSYLSLQDHHELGALAGRCHLLRQTRTPLTVTAAPPTSAAAPWKGARMPRPHGTPCWLEGLSQKSESPPTWAQVFL